MRRLLALRSASFCSLSSLLGLAVFALAAPASAFADELPPHARLSPDLETFASSPAKRKAKRAKAARGARAAAVAAVPLESDPRRAAGFSMGVNFPLTWSDDGMGGSMSFGFRHHYAVRANFASYEVQQPVSFEYEGTNTGRTSDVGLGLVWYPRQLWSGPTFELGVVGRGRDLDIRDPNAKYSIVSTDTHVYGGRALVGWSWHFEPFYIAVAAGAFVGYETGTEFTEGQYDEMKVRSNVHRTHGDFESYFRFGFAFFGQ